MNTTLHIFPADIDASAVPPRPELALASGPRQSILLRQKGWHVVDLISSFGDATQMAVVNEIDRVAARLPDLLAAHDVEPALIELLQAVLADQVSAWRRFEHATVGHEHFLVWDGVAFQQLTREAAYERMLAPWGKMPIMETFSSGMRRLIRRTNMFTAATFGRDSPCMVDLRTESARFELEQNVPQLKLRFLHKADLRRIVPHALKLGIEGKRQRRILIPIEQDGGAAALASSIWNDPVFATLPRLAVATLRAAAGSYLSARDHMAAFLAAAPPRRFIGIFNELYSARTAGIASALRAAGHATILINHGSLCVHGEGPIERLLALRARAGINSSRNATHLVPRAPYILRGLPDAPAPEILRCRFNKTLPTPAKEATGKRPFVILHAGNYVTWGGAAFINPTESEYFQALLDIAAVVENNPALRMDVRIKVGVIQPVDWRDRPLNSKTRLIDPDQFAALHPWSDLVAPSAQPKFMDALAQADLLVSDGPTATIAEALEAGKPVLFHTLTDRFRHMPARTEPPRPDDRAAVYWCASGEKLPGMIEAIRLAHQNRPLTNAELAPHRWSATSPGIPDEIGNALYCRRPAP